MPDPVPDLTAQIAAAAAGPASVAMSDGRSAAAVRLPDLIVADKYLAGKAAQTDPATGRRRNPFACLRPGHVVPPGAI